MGEIKLIIEQYKKRLQTLKNTNGLDAIVDIRLRTKASCYRTIISELERTLAETTGESSNNNKQHVSNNEVALKSFVEEFVHEFENGNGGHGDMVLYRKAKSLL